MFCYSEHFVENEKDINHLVKGLVNMMDGVEKTRLNPIFFPAWFLLNVILRYLEKHNVSPIDKCRAFFLEDFHALFGTFESISLQWVSSCGLKTPNK